MIKIKLASAISVLALALLGCSSEQSNHSADASSGNNQPQEDIVAQVSSEKIPDFTITQAELDLMVGRMGGSAAVAVGGEAFIAKVRQSLIVSKAMALSAASGMSQDQLSEIELKTQQYREELLVKAWLKDRVTANPPSVEEVEAYYQANLAEFGQKQLKQIEVLNVLPPKSNHTSVTAMKALSESLNNDNWNQTIQQLREQGVSLSAKQHELEINAATSSQILSERVLAMVKPLSKGEISKVSVIDGQWFVVRVTNERTISAKPLSEVSGQIRKRLAPMKFRESVKALTDELYKSLTVKS